MAAAVARRRVSKRVSRRLPEPAIVAVSAAGLAGQLEAITAQNKELMAAIQKVQPEKKTAAPRKRTVSKKPVVKEGLNDEHQTNG